jgi:hypothetical protein
MESTILCSPGSSGATFSSTNDRNLLAVTKKNKHDCFFEGYHTINCCAMARVLDMTQIPTFDPTLVQRTPGLKRALTLALGPRRFRANCALIFVERNPTRSIRGHQS